jgi:hypothetical protein
MKECANNCNGAKNIETFSLCSPNLMCSSSSISIKLKLLVTKNINISNIPTKKDAFIDQKF